MDNRLWYGRRVRYTDAADVERLDSGSQIQLLTEGDPPERVWAAWSLGVKQASKSVPLLQSRLRVEPNTGVRRHLLTMLAGLGAREAVARAATRDTSPRVRATALELLIRVAGADDPAVFDLIGGRLFEEHPTVRAAVLRALPPDSPWLSRLPSLLQDDAIEVRWAARERAASHRKADPRGPRFIPTRFPLLVIPS